ncbi:MAG: DUF1611 domain-containing protein [Desulfuromonas sp.]|nr:MAG: DUF1611 domain-containing protein [Desulfuromonas sp.]
METISADRLRRAKWAYTTRRVDQVKVAGILTDSPVPQAGDLVLARVDSLGQHRRLELTTSRRAEMFEGDEIVVAFGNRYAPDQFEGIVPDKFEPCRLVAAGGVAARVLNWHTRMKRATKITPIGLLTDKKGNRINLRNFRMPQTEGAAERPFVLAVAGTSMNSGKTTACSNLVKGMVRRNLRVAAAKITGTGAGADYRILVDAGADPVYDFVDAGYVSTYRITDEALLDVVKTLCGHLEESGVDIIILEIADGLLQRETARIFNMAEFTSRLDGIIFAANDALGAQSGISRLSSLGLPLIGCTGVLTSSPLATRETEAATGLPVYQTNNLRRAHVAAMVYNTLRNRRRKG